MDIEMPNMNGLDATKKIMEICPRPVIMISSVTLEGSEATLKALSLGAADFIPKKSSFVQLDILQIERELIEKIRYWGKRKHTYMRTSDAVSLPSSSSHQVNYGEKKTQEMKHLSSEVPLRVVTDNIELVVLGISTGGPIALVTLFKKMKKLKRPVVIAQHMPPTFTKSLAAHLKRETEHDVVEGSHQLALYPGLVVICRGGVDSVISEVSANTFILSEQEDSPRLLRPSVDCLFESVSHIGSNFAAVVMTGMGSDGAKGAKGLAFRKCPIIAQKPETCIVDGMPKSVIDAKCVTHILNIEEIAEFLSRICGD
jgi:two-component system chemotaxis response regulator CheB